MPDEGAAWTRGFGTAQHENPGRVPIPSPDAARAAEPLGSARVLAKMHRMLCRGFEASKLHRKLSRGLGNEEICAATRDAGLSVANFRGAGLGDRDLEELVRAGVDSQERRSHD